MRRHHIRPCTTALLAAALLLGSASGASATSSGLPSASSDAGPGASPSASSLTVVAAKKKRVALRVTSRTTADVGLGKRITFRGVASKALKGKTVRLQHRVAGTWRTIAKSKVRSSRKFTVSAVAKLGGAQKYRVYAAKTKRTRAASTRAYTYRVWSWQNLAPKGFAALNVDPLDRTYYVGSTGFANSIKQDTGTLPASVKFQLNRQCSTLETWVGLSTMPDGSGATREFWLNADGVQRSLGVQGLGAARKVTTSLTGVNEMRLGISSSASPTYFGIYGTPRAYCLGELPAAPPIGPGGSD